MTDDNITFNCVRCGFETEDKSHGCPACGCGLLLPHEKWRNSHLGELPNLPDGVARRLRGKDGTSPELTMVEKAREHISRTPMPSKDLEALEQDIDAEVQQALSADIPLPPVEYLIAEERGIDSKEDKSNVENEVLSQVDEEIVTALSADVELIDDDEDEGKEHFVLNEETVSEPQDASSFDIPRRNNDPTMMALHDTFFKDETVQTDPEISLEAIREEIRSAEGLAYEAEIEAELPSDALEPLAGEENTSDPDVSGKALASENEFEELGDEAEIEPLPTQALKNDSSIVLDSEPDLGLEAALAREDNQDGISSELPYRATREVQTTGFVSSEDEATLQSSGFFDNDGNEIPYIQPENSDEPALWREPRTWQVFCAGLIDTLLVLMCVTPVTIVATVSKQEALHSDAGLWSAIPWNVIVAFWGSAFLFHALLTFASIYWTGATAGGNLLRISVLRTVDAERPAPAQAGLLALFSALGLLCLMLGPFFALWLQRRFRGPGHIMAGTVPAIPNVERVA